MNYKKENGNYILTNQLVDDYGDVHDALIEVMVEYNTITVGTLSYVFRYIDYVTSIFGAYRKDRFELMLNNFLDRCPGKIYISKEKLIEDMHKFIKEHELKMKEDEYNNEWETKSKPDTNSLFSWFYRC